MDINEEFNEVAYRFDDPEFAYNLLVAKHSYFMSQNDQDVFLKKIKREFPRRLNQEDRLEDGHPVARLRSELMMLLINVDRSIIFNEIAHHYTDPKTAHQMLEKNNSKFHTHGDLLSFLEDSDAAYHRRIDARTPHSISILEHELESLGEPDHDPETMRFGQPKRKPNLDERDAVALYPYRNPVHGHFEAMDIEPDIQ